MARAGRQVEVLRPDRVRWERQQQRSQRGGENPDQALSETAAI